MFTSEKDSHRKAVSFLSLMVIDFRGLTYGFGHRGCRRYYIQVQSHQCVTQSGANHLIL